MKRDKDLLITNVPDTILNDLNNIAKNLGVDRSKLLKPKLREIRDSFPEYLRAKPRE